MPKLHVHGVGYNVEIDGEGPPLVALHGFTGDAASWTSLRQAAHGTYTVITPDMLGHGGTDSPSDAACYTMDHTLRDLAALLDALGLSTVRLLGYSMGGRVALSFAIAMPQRVDALVLESASPGVAGAEERAARVAADERLAQLAEQQGITAFVDYWQSIPLWDSQRRLPQETRNRLRAQRLRGNPAGLANSLRGIGQGAQPPVHEHLGQLTMPVCCIVGSDDARYKEWAAFMSPRVKGSQVIVIPEAGHAAHLEQPAAFNAAVLDFLRTTNAAEARRTEVRP